MADEKDIEIKPVLTEVSELMESSSELALNALFSESIPALMAKVASLESLLRLSTRDCNFNDFLREILTIILRVVKCEAGSILEADHENKSLFFRAVAGTCSDRIINFVVPFGKGFVGHVLETGITQVVNNVPENKLHFKWIEKTVGFETRNLVAIPIFIRGKVYGIVELLNRVGEPNFNSEDVEILNYVCQMAARTIEIRLMISWAKQNTNEKRNAA